MAESLPPTDYFGFTRVGQGESVAKDGHAALDLDVVTRDALHHAHEIHDHSGHARLQDPSVPPVLATSTTGGSLPAATAFYYKVGLIDKYGLETAASPEQSISTGAQIASPTPPSVQVEPEGGTVTGGLYSYVITYATDSGGETLPSRTSEIVVASGSANRIRLDLPALVAGATRYRIYRRRPGQALYYYVADVTAGPWYDTGLAEDVTINPPTANTTNAQNSITVTIPTGVVAANVFGWKIYRSTTPGTYTGHSLVHEVVEPTAEFDTDLRTTWVDTGDTLHQGMPRTRSATLSGGIPIDLTNIQGQFPMTALPRGSRSLEVFCRGTIVNDKVYAKTYLPGDIVPTRITAYFQDAPGDLGGATPKAVVFSFTDAQATPQAVQLSCASPGQFFSARFTETDGDQFEAENGSRSNVTAIPISNDGQASNGQAVELNANNEYVDLLLGNLDGGTYTPYARVRRASGNVALPTGSDLAIQAIRTDTDEILSHKAVDDVVVSATTYSEKAGANFVVPDDEDGIPVKIRVYKNTTGNSVWLIDKVRYEALNLVTLVKGVLTVSAALVNAPATPGGDVQLVIWY